MTKNILELEKDWTKIKRGFERAQAAGLYHGFATINADGTPNITPIGSLVLDSDQPRGFYFDVFNRSLGENLQRNPNVAVLAVDSRKLVWLAALIRRRFIEPPALRLIGTVSRQRSATADEVQRCLKQVKSIQRLGASSRLGRQLKLVREIHFTRVDKLNIGTLTRA